EYNRKGMALGKYCTSDQPKGRDSSRTRNRLAQIPCQENRNLPSGSSSIPLWAKDGATSAGIGGYDLTIFVIWGAGLALPRYCTVHKCTKSKVSARWPFSTKTCRFQEITTRYFRHQLISNF